MTLVIGTGCSDRMAPGVDRDGRSGELVAMSGGQGGARYACVGCHGARGEGNGFDAPRLAGLPAGYLQKQMEDYAAGLRPHALMRDVARFLDSRERVLVANHYAALPPRALPPASTEAVSERAVALYARACGHCHGTEAEGTAAGPPLAGQPALYTAQQLRDWQLSKRRGDALHEMLRVAQALEPEDIKILGVYLAQIPPRPAPGGR